MFCVSRADVPSEIMTADINVRGYTPIGPQQEIVIAIGRSDGEVREYVFNIPVSAARDLGLHIVALCDEIYRSEHVELNPKDQDNG